VDREFLPPYVAGRSRQEAQDAGVPRRDALPTLDNRFRRLEVALMLSKQLLESLKEWPVDNPIFAQLLLKTQTRPIKVI
jgi:hypothetical protein